ncbi:MAG: penicillin-binding transpeptidase domain-containing protein [Actinomycetota bacterium]|nr:penicillin-binding transpeptidase domain-containing protein [Actinomycetota bacterium]
MNDRPSNSATRGGQRYKMPHTDSRQGPAHEDTSGERRQRLLSRTVPLILLSVGSFAVGVAVGGSTEGSQVAKRFADAWERQDFEAMHTELSPSSQESYPLDAFTRLYIDTQATATAIEVGTGEPEVDDDAASFSATVSTHAFGDVEGTVRAPLDEDGAIAWEPHLTFPGLATSERLGRDTRVGERAALLAADGSALAEGSASARTSPLGPSAIAIAGALGSPSRKQETEQYARGFPEGTLAGTTGLELAFNAQLAGQPSGELFALGPDGEKRPLATGEPAPGETVKTTIDPEIQTATVTALGEQYGGVAVLDARTGDVRGVAGLAFSAPQPPGSTFKIITAVAGLDAGVVSLEDEFPVESSNSLIGREISNAHDELCGGTFVRSFADSCNTVFAPLGVEIGKEKMVETAEAFGFNSEPTLAAPDALESLAPPPSSLGDIESDVALGESSIGQGQVLATPLAMASVAQTIANDGTRLPTSIVTTPELRPTSEPVEVTSTETAEAVEGMMLEVVRSGTGVAAQIPGIPVAGKTGTAELGPKALAPGQTLAPGEDPPQEENAWFASYAPVEKPELAIAVMLINATGGGGTVAAPIAREIYASVLPE